jgi:uncharacterized protein YwqG
LKHDLTFLLQQLKKPTLKFSILPTIDHSPSLASYIGGKPYMTKEDQTPCCKQCKKPLTFAFQLYMQKEKESVLFVFYYCFQCQSKQKKNHFDMMVYHNPTLEEMNPKTKKNSLIEYAEFEFHPSWSLPEWDVLQSIHSDLVDHLSKEFKDDAWVVYENTKESLVGLAHLEPFSFYKGYPQFLSEPRFPTCKCCKKPMELFIQLDSYEEFGLSWGEMGCLYVFQCPHHENEFKIFIQ